MIQYPTTNFRLHVSVIEKLQEYSHSKYVVSHTPKCVCQIVLSKSPFMKQGVSQSMSPWIGGTKKSTQGTCISKSGQHFASKGKSITFNHLQKQSWISFLNFLAMDLQCTLYSQYYHLCSECCWTEPTGVLSVEECFSVRATKAQLCRGLRYPNSISIWLKIMTTT